MLKFLDGLLISLKMFQKNTAALRLKGNVSNAASSPSLKLFRNPFLSVADLNSYIHFTVLGKKVCDIFVLKFTKHLDAALKAFKSEECFSLPGV